jgi:hypothetical protein
MLLHIAMMAEFINPRQVWCFTGEDMMHKVQGLGQSCVRGVRNPRATVKMAKHYRLGLNNLFKQAV